VKTRLTSTLGSLIAASIRLAVFLAAKLISLFGRNGAAALGNIRRSIRSWARAGDAGSLVGPEADSGSNILGRACRSPHIGGAVAESGGEGYSFSPPGAASASFGSSSSQLGTSSVRLSLCFLPPAIGMVLIHNNALAYASEYTKESLRHD
jgi:hypothetical protein